MLRKVNWLARAAGYLWVGVMAFLAFPPNGSFALWAQAIGYCALGAALVALAVLEAGSRRAEWLAAVLATMAGAAGFAGATGSGGSAIIVFGCVATMIAGAELDLVAALAVTAFGVLAVELGGLIAGGSYGTLVGLPTFLISTLVVGRNRGAYRVQAEQAAALLRQQEQLQAEQRRADLLDERARIAREIHDVLAHSLGALGIQVQAARAVLTDHGDIDQAAELLATAQQLAAEGLVETRRAVHALRSEPAPLPDELARVSDTYAQRYQVSVDFGTEGVPAPLPPDASLALLRTAQEALVNAAKHAPGHGVAVQLDYRPAGVRLTVRNGLVAGAANGSVRTVDGGYGLTGMRERLRLLRGSLDAGPREHEWVVTADVPFDARESMSS